MDYTSHREICKGFHCDVHLDEIVGCLSLRPQRVPRARVKGGHAAPQGVLHGRPVRERLHQDGTSVNMLRIGDEKSVLIELQSIEKCLQGGLLVDHRTSLLSERCEQLTPC
eukprot:8629094-Pyramimonas_sp.AAC.1